MAGGGPRGDRHRRPLPPLRLRRASPDRPTASSAACGSPPSTAPLAVAAAKLARRLGWYPGDWVWLALAAGLARDRGRRGRDRLPSTACTQRPRPRPSSPRPFRLAARVVRAGANGRTDLAGRSRRLDGRARSPRPHPGRQQGAARARGQGRPQRPPPGRRARLVGLSRACTPATTSSSAASTVHHRRREPRARNGAGEGFGGRLRAAGQPREAETAREGRRSSTDRLEASCQKRKHL